MKQKTTRLIQIFIVFAMIIFGKDLLASHLHSGEITYKILDTQNRRYRIFLTRYRACSGVEFFGVPDLIIRRENNGQLIPLTLQDLGKTDVTPLCPGFSANCPQGNAINGIEGVQRQIMYADVTLGKNGWFTIYSGDCCRANNITNITTGVGVNQYIITTLNTDYVNNSIQFLNDPIPFICQNSYNSYSPYAADTNEVQKDYYVTINGKTYLRDSIAYKMTSPWVDIPTNSANVNSGIDGPGRQATFLAGYSKTQFAKTTPGTGGIQFDEITGTLRMNPLLGLTQFTNTAIAIQEYRIVAGPNGTVTRELISTVVRDVLFSINGDCKLPTDSGIIVDSSINIIKESTYKANMCGSRYGKVTIKAIGEINENMKMDLILSNKLKYDLINLRFDTIVDRKSSTDTFYASLSWDSIRGVGEESLILNFYYCNVFGKKTGINIPLTIEYQNSVFIDKDTGYYCIGGDPFIATAHGGAASYTWSPPINLQILNTDSSVAALSPSVSGWYYVVGKNLKDSKYCSNIDSIYIKVIPRFNYTIEPKVIEMCLMDTTSILITPQVSDTPYKYTWLNKEFGVYNRITKTFADSTTNNPFVINTGTIDLPVIIESKYNCRIRDTVKIINRGVKANPIGILNRDLLCIGDTTLLTSNLSPIKSGISMFKTLVNNQSTYSGSNQTSYPNIGCSGTTCQFNIYGTNFFGKSSTIRLVYTKSELNSIGITAGVIKSIGFYINSLNVPKIDRFSIKMGSLPSTNTNATSLEPVSLVYFQKSINLVSNLNTYVLDREFVWNGEDNLLIEVCSANDVFTPLFNQVKTISLAAGNRVAGRISNDPNVDACNMNTPLISASVNSARPVITFGWNLIDKTYKDSFFEFSMTPTSMINTQLANPGYPNFIVNSSLQDSLIYLKFGNNFCNVVDTVKLLADPNFSITGFGDITRCINPAASSITLSAKVVSLVNNYTYSWESLPLDGTFFKLNDSTATVNPIAKNIYKYVVKATSSVCTVKDTIYVNISDSLDFTFTKIDPLCTSNTGEITANLPLGSLDSNYTFSWTNDTSTTKMAKNLAAGNYLCTVKLKSDLTCKATKSQNLVAITKPVNITLNASAIKCFGNNSDSIYTTIDSSGFTTPVFKYLWSSGETTKNIYNKAKGTYTLTVTDSITGCSGTKTITVTEPSAITNIKTIGDVKCKGGNSGFINNTTTGGTPNLTYLWTSKNGKNINIPNFDDISNLYQDTLYLVVTDKNNCKYNDTFIVKEPIDSLKVILTPTNATFVKGCDGKILGTATGGTSNYTFSWDSIVNNIHYPMTTTPNVTGSSTLLNLCKKLYSLKVTDANGCTTIDSVMVKDIDCKIIANFNKVDVLCFGEATGQAIFGVIDSLNYLTTANYTYELKNSSNVVVATINNPLSSPNAAPDTFKNILAGIYSVHVTTNKGCDTSYNNLFNITQNPKMIITDSSINPSCAQYNDGEVYLKVNDMFGPYQYSNDKVTFITDNFRTGLNASVTNKFYIKNSLNCIDSFNKKLTDPDSITVSHFVDKEISCFGGNDSKVTLTATRETLYGTVKYLSKPGTNVDILSPVIENIDKGNKTVDVEYHTSNDLTKSCIFQYNFIMTEPTKLVVSPTTTDANCSYSKNGKIDLNPNNTSTPNYSFSLYDNTFSLLESTNNKNTYTFENLDSNTYNVITVCSKGCIDTLKNILIDRPDSLIATINFTNSSCIESENGKIEIVNIVGGNGAPYQYITNTFPTATINDITTNVIQNLVGPKNYKTDVIDSKGCIYSQQSFIDVDYILSMNPLLIDSVKCFGGNDGLLTVEISSINQKTIPYTYSWSNGSTEYQLKDKIGEYTVTVTDVNNCTLNATATLSEPEKIVVSGNVKDATCKNNDGEIKVTAIGGNLPYIAYNWGDPVFLNSSTATQLSANTYVVVVVDTKGCTGTETFEVLKPKPFYLVFDTINHITCYGSNDGKISLHPIDNTTDVSYSWNLDTRNSNSIDNLKPNINYSVVATDQLGCTAVLSTEIKEPLKLIFEDLRTDSVSCPNVNDGIIEIFAKGGTIDENAKYQYSLDGGTSYESSRIFTNLSSGSYTVVIKDINGCLAIKKVEIFAPEEIFILAKKDPSIDSINIGEKINVYIEKSSLSGNIPSFNSIRWTPSESIECSYCETTNAYPYNTQKYEVEVNYLKNCIANSSIIIPVKDPLDFYVPNAFSPNNDLKNDVLYLYGTNIKKINFIIFNRWGEKVFETNSQAIGWDGNFKNEKSESGVYTFYAEVEYLNGENKNKKGSITLIR